VPGPIAGGVPGPIATGGVPGPIAGGVPGPIATGGVPGPIAGGVPGPIATGGVPGPIAGGVPGPILQIAGAEIPEAESVAAFAEIFRNPTAPVSTNKTRATTVRHLDIRPPEGELTRGQYM
jgi:hypothetical protein